MSKPLTAVKLSGEPSRTTARPVVRVPALAGFWMNSLLLVESRT
jgi:hypothetical protein